MEDPVAHLVELASCNNVFLFRKSADQNPALVDQIGSWYVHRKGSMQMFMENRTPLMVAAAYGSVDVVKLMIQFQVEVNKSCGLDKATALHCAASSGSERAFEIAEMLLAAGANPNLTNASGRRPVDVILVTSNSQGLMKLSLERLLNPIPNSQFLHRPVARSTNMFSTDEFRMYQFKVHPCSRVFAHDWTECPDYHPGENARRRDPKKYNYKPIACREYRKGYCDWRDKCQFAHGMFECGMHPAQYRTQMCNEAWKCKRKICFFAHCTEELRHNLHFPSFLHNPIDNAAALDLHCPPVSPANNNMALKQPQQFVDSNLAPRQNLPNYWGASSSGLGKIDGDVNNYEEEEPDISWVHNLLVDTNDDIMVPWAFESFGVGGNSLSGSAIDAVLKSLLDQMETLDQIKRR